MMVYEYVVSVKNERGRYINILSQLLCLISAVFFVVQQVRFGTPYYILYVIAGVIVAALVYNHFAAIRKNHLVSYGRVLALAGFTWLTMPFLQWLVAPFLLLALIEKHAKSPLEIGITNDHVVFNSLIKRVLPWEAFTNILLKDGLLTIDFKNNRLFQKEVVDDTTDVIETEFNQFCRKRLAREVSKIS